VALDFYGAGHANGFQEGSIGARNMRQLPRLYASAVADCQLPFAGLPRRPSHIP
jgi:hypothetical protein